MHKHFEDWYRVIAMIENDISTGSEFTVAHIPVMYHIFEKFLDWYGSFYEYYPSKHGIMVSLRLCYDYRLFISKYPEDKLIGANERESTKHVNAYKKWVELGMPDRDDCQIKIRVDIKKDTP